MGQVPGDGMVRFAEVVASLAVAQDHCFGQPAGSQQRGTLLALAVADALGASPAERSTVYWSSLLRFLGCTGHAHEIAVVFGDDIATRAHSFEWDAANPAELARALFASTAGRHKGLARARAVAALLAGGRKNAELNFRTGCEVADEFGRRLGLPLPVREALAHSFERWNGGGFPKGLEGEAIAFAARVALVSQEIEVLTRVHGPREGIAIARRRAGRSYDPRIVDVAAEVAPDAVGALDALDPWDATLAADPEPWRTLSGDDLDGALQVLADFADLKSPYTAGHSRGVADLAERAAIAAGLGDRDRLDVRRAALLHDIGRCAVSNAVWDKPSALTRDERDDVQTHALRSEQLWRRSPGLAPYVSLLATHHERADGTGYHRSVPAGQLPLAARILCAADCLHALGEARAHRPAVPPATAAAIVREAVATGHLDAIATDAVLAAAGAHPSGRRSGGPDGLTSREVDVLVLVARGLTIKQVAAQLSIAPKTADAHLQHVYTKIGVSTRGAAALYAMRNGLIAA